MQVSNVSQTKQMHIPFQESPDDSAEFASNQFVHRGYTRGERRRRIISPGRCPGVVHCRAVRCIKVQYHKL